MGSLGATSLPVRHVQKIEIKEPEPKVQTAWDKPQRVSTVDSVIANTLNLDPAVGRAAEWVRRVDWQGANRSRYRGYREDLLSPPGGPPCPLWRAVRRHPFGDPSKNGHALNS